MSGYAYMWAKRQQVGDPAAKNVLKSYAHWASEDYSTWVTNEELLLDTELNIQTIRKARQKLIALGYLIETTRRMGETRSVVVYQMVAPEGATTVQSVDAKGSVVLLSPPSREEYEAKQVQKRSPSKTGAPSRKGGEKPSPSKNEGAPDPTSSPSKSHVKPLQISSEAPPNLDPKRDLGLQELSRESTAGAENSLSPEIEETAPSPQGTRIHPDWKPNDAQIAFAMKERPAWDMARVEREARKFRNHWLAKPGAAALRMDWNAMWENWVFNDDPTRSPAAGGAPTTGSADGDRWYESTAAEVIDARGAELGVRPRKPDESVVSYRVLVVKASREKAAVDHVLRDARKFNSQQLFDFAVATFGEELLPVDFYAS